MANSAIERENQESFRFAAPQPETGRASAA
jgi:hypothetical protein